MYKIHTQNCHLQNPSITTVVILSVDAQDHPDIYPHTSHWRHLSS